MLKTKLTAEDVKAEVHRFWNSFQAKATASLSDMYAPEATVFSSVSNRVEPGRLAAARRHREYFHAKSTIRASVSNIDVVMLGENAAVASYNFMFHATKVAGGVSGGHDEDIKQGRASHVFMSDMDGKLRIVHEHFSTVDKPA